MKRSGFKRRSKPLQRGGYLNRNTRMAPVNKERKAKAFAKDFGPLAFHVRTHACVCCGSDASNTQACHVKSKGAGGHAWNDDGSGNLLPMCGVHHRYQHDHGWKALAALMGGVEEGREWAERLAHDIGEEFLAAGGERY